VLIVEYIMRFTCYSELNYTFRPYLLQEFSSWRQCAVSVVYLL